MTVKNKNNKHKRITFRVNDEENNELKNLKILLDEKSISSAIRSAVHLLLVGDIDEF